jgi:hypothetical protein
VAREDRLRILLTAEGDGQVKATLQGVKRSFSDTQASIISFNQALDLVGKGYQIVRTAAEPAITLAERAVRAWG